MATPAQVANDMAAQADYWRGRDGEIEKVCRDAARVIRALVDKSTVDERTLYGLQKSLVALTVRALQRGYPQVHLSLTRARLTLEELCGWSTRS